MLTEKILKLYATSTEIQDAGTSALLSMKPPEKAIDMSLMSRS
jgi:hypothetical protein|tara:strand:- start:442 stop:570 length:129 start_codon:yes stop_codon:yes gene_type:complete